MAWKEWGNAQMCAQKCVWWEGYSLAGVGFASPALSRRVLLRAILVFLTGGGIDWGW